MNKQEVIEKIEKEKSNLNAWEDLTRNHALDDALTIIRKLDEPEKPVVPQFVADWLEVCKKNLVLSLASSMNNIVMSANKQPDETIHWVARNSETFAKAWLYGYEIEKYKLYTVELPNPKNSFKCFYIMLTKTADGRVVLSEVVDSHIALRNDIKLTEAEIKEDFEWAWQFAKEVEE